jgi:hypothetical protein
MNRPVQLIDPSGRTDDYPPLNPTIGPEQEPPSVAWICSLIPDMDLRSSREGFATLTELMQFLGQINDRNKCCRNPRSSGDCLLCPSGGSPDLFYRRCDDCCTHPRVRMRNWDECRDNCRKVYDWWKAERAGK